MPTTSNVFNTTGNSTVLGIVLIIDFVILIAVIAAFLFAIKSFADVAKDKGHRKTGLIWFLGIFATPIVAGLYTLQLRDLKKEKREKENNAQEIQFYSSHLVAIEQQLGALKAGNPGPAQSHAPNYQQSQYQPDGQQYQFSPQEYQYAAQQYQYNAQQQAQLDLQQQTQFDLRQEAQFDPLQQARLDLRQEAPLNPQQQAELDSRQPARFDSLQQVQFNPQQQSRFNPQQGYQDIQQ